MRPVFAGDRVVRHGAFGEVDGRHSAVRLPALGRLAAESLAKRPLAARPPSRRWPGLRQSGLARVGKGSLVRDGLVRLPEDRSWPGQGSGAEFMGGAAGRPADRQLADEHRQLSGADALAGEHGAFLSASLYAQERLGRFQHAELLRGGHWPVSAVDGDRGRSGLLAEGVPCRGLVLVPGDADAGHRHSAGGHAGPGRSLHLPADDWRLPDDRLALEGSGRGAGRRPASAWRGPRWRS